MSTRSVVAHKGRGVYVHFDGYPEHMVPTLLNLVHEHGVDEVQRTLLSETAGWSFLGQDEEQHNVPGYGRAYRDGANMIHTGDGIDSQAFAYVLHDDAIEVRTGGRVVARFEYARHAEVIEGFTGGR